MNYLVYKNGFHLPHDFLKIKVLLFAGISTYNKQFLFIIHVNIQEKMCIVQEGKRYLISTYCFN